ncbi:MAG: C10 family peptidase, partial [Muribaculaceae bacterium]|nr:C10 family peptidase [Muribaculaceae bacterium]
MKKANLLLAASLIALGAQAEALSPVEALARVGSGAARRIAARSVNVQPELTVARHSEVPELYVFAPAEGGLLILSADSDAPALLGYSENFVAGEQLPPALEMMLEGYAEEIDAIRTGAEPGSASRSGSDDFKAISPICKTVWNQLAPYNEQTPVINGTQSPTGCEATAMAQVLKVYEYPAKCTGGTFTYQMSGQTMSINFDDVTLDWANMLNTYSGSKDPAVNRTAVATLMKALGYCAKTTYRASSSSAATSIMAAGVVKFFNYDDATIALDRNWFQPAQWEQMVYDELAAGYPVLYSGSNSSGGHAFVVDGYKGDGLYHVNWGWGGISDGYFLLTSLDPQQQGVGGSTAGYIISILDIFKL